MNSWMTFLYFLLSLSWHCSSCSLLELLSLKNSCFPVQLHCDAVLLLWISEVFDALAEGGVFHLYRVYVPCAHTLAQPVNKLYRNLLRSLLGLTRTDLPVFYRQVPASMIIPGVHFYILWSSRAAVSLFLSHGWVLLISTFTVFFYLLVGSFEMTFCLSFQWVVCLLDRPVCWTAKQSNVLSFVDRMFGYLEYL